MFEESWSKLLSINSEDLFTTEDITSENGAEKLVEQEEECTKLKNIIDWGNIKDSIESTKRLLSSSIRRDVDSIRSSKSISRSLLSLTEEELSV